MKKVGDKLEKELEKAGVDLDSFYVSRGIQIAKERTTSVVYDDLELEVWNHHFSIYTTVLNWRELWN